MTWDESHGTECLGEADLAYLRRKLVSYVKRLCSDRDLVEDHVQEALLRGWQSAGFPREREAALRWLKCTAYRLWIDRFRRRGAHVRLIGDASMLDDGGSDTSEVHESTIAIGERRVTWSALHGELANAWDHVPDTYRRLIRARYERGASFHEIASQFGTTVGSVKMRLYRGRRALARVIEDRIRSRASRSTSRARNKGRR
ncbi:MAG: RNA polymerase sigma factor [Planctomycetes bacterium]|nr:RNA polymerase sigma factor [Planctomycetota bacterium]